MKNWLIIGAIIIVIAIAGIFYYNSTSTQQEIPSEQSNTESAASQNTVAQEGFIEARIENFAFVPAEIKIKVGSKITWINNDNTIHTIASDSGGKGELSSGVIGKDESWGHVFNEKGVFNYHCGIHSSMKGKVVVE